MMKKLKYNLLILLLIVGIKSISAQSYAKDSLQIKAYTEIQYKKGIAQDSIKLKKVFCDFCTDLQKKAIGEEALNRAYNERYYPENKLENGKKRLAIYIRIAKKDFAAIKEDE